MCVYVCVCVCVCVCERERERESVWGGGGCTVLSEVSPLYCGVFVECYCCTIECFVEVLLLYCGVLLLYCGVICGDVTDVLWSGL